MEMDKNLNYQQARRIRGADFSSIFADQMLYEPTVMSAVKRTLSLKIQSKAKGFTEKFDPLNIAKTLTMGSRWAPALLGKMTGRSKQDTEYFTGRLRPVAVRTGSKVTTVPKEGEQLVEGKNVRFSGNDGMNQQLLKIYKLLKKSQDSDKRRKELDRNFDEEKHNEAEKRHQQLLKKLEQFTTGGVGVAGGTSTATEVESQQSSPFEDMLNSIISSGMMDLLTGGLEVLGVALIPVIAGVLFDMWWKDYQQRKSQENIQEMADKGGASATEAQTKIEELRKTEDVSGATGPMSTEAASAQAQVESAVKRKRHFVSEYLKQNGGYEPYVPWYSKLRKYEDGTPYEVKYENKNGDAPSAELMKKASDYADGKVKKIWTGEVQDPIGEYKKITPTAQKVQSGPSGADMDAFYDAGPAPVQPKESLQQVSTGGNTQRLNTAMVENADALLTKQKADDNVTVNNVVKNASKKAQEIAKLNEIAVRNDEPTLLRMIMNSTSFV